MQRTSRSDRGKMQRAGPYPHRLPPAHQHRDEQERDRAHDRLDAEAQLRPLGAGPLDLEVADDEAAEGARVVDPGRDLARRLGVAVEVVRRHGDGRDHGAEDVEAPAHGRDDEVPLVLQALPEEHEAQQHEGEGDDDGAEAHLGLEVALVGSD